MQADEGCRRSVQMHPNKDDPSSTRQNLLEPIMMMSSIYQGTLLTQQGVGYEAPMMAEGAEEQEELL